MDWIILHEIRVPISFCFQKIHAVSSSMESFIFVLVILSKWKKGK